MGLTEMRRSNTRTDFNRPSAIEISDDGKVLITDNQRARIQIYQKEYDWVDPQFNL